MAQSNGGGSMKDTETVTLDEILDRIVSQEAITEGGYAEYTDDVVSIERGNQLHNKEELKQALIKLFEQAVESAKPEKHLVQEDSDIYDDYGHDREQLRHELQENNINIGHNSAIDFYEQNLLQALSNSGNTPDE